MYLEDQTPSYAQNSSTKDYGFKQASARTIKIKESKQMNASGKKSPNGMPAKSKVLSKHKDY